MYRNKQRGSYEFLHSPPRDDLAARRRGTRTREPAGMVTTRGGRCDGTQAGGTAAGCADRGRRVFERTARGARRAGHVRCLALHAGLLVREGQSLWRAGRREPARDPRHVEHSRRRQCVGVRRRHPVFGLDPLVPVRYRRAGRGDQGPAGGLVRPCHLLRGHQPDHEEGQQRTGTYRERVLPSTAIPR